MPNLIVGIVFLIHVDRNASVQAHLAQCIAAALKIMFVLMAIVSMCLELCFCNVRCLLQEVAMKQLNHAALNDDEAMQLFLHEISLTASLNHPNIAEVLILQCSMRICRQF